MRQKSKQTQVTFKLNYLIGSCNQIRWGFNYNGWKDATFEDRDQIRDNYLNMYLPVASVMSTRVIFKSINLLIRDLKS